MLVVVARELSTAARRNGTYWHRVTVAAVTGLVALSILLLAPSRRMMFDALSWIVFILAVLEGARATSDALARERREGTLGLLMMTPLGAHQVVWGKLAAASVRSAGALVAVLPVFALSLLMGGVTYGEWSRVAVAFLTALGLGLSAGLIASALTESAFLALVGSVAFCLIFCAVPFVIDWMRPGAKESLAWLAGPAAVFLGADAIRFKADAAHFWKALLFSVITGAGMVAMTGAVLEKIWRRQPSLNQGWWWRLMRPSVGASEAWGGASGADDPAVWIAERTLPGRKLLWGVLAVVLLIYLLLGAYGSGVAAGALIVTQLAMGLLLKLWAAAVSPQSIHAARRGGALELILCTPLSVEKLVRGQIDAITGYLFAPALVTAVGLWTAATIGGAITKNDSFLDAIIISFPFGLIWFVGFLLDMHALAYVGLWQGLNSVKAEAAIARTVGAVLLLPIATAIVPIFGWLGLVLWPWFWIKWASRKLSLRFREVAAERT